MKRALLAAALTLGLGTVAQADPLVGTWRTAPDDNGHTGLIEVVLIEMEISECMNEIAGLQTADLSHH